MVLVSGVQQNDSIFVYTVIIIINLVTISHHIKLTFRIYSLGNFQICCTVLLTVVTMLYITSQGLITGSL